MNRIYYFLAILMNVYGVSHSQPVRNVKALSGMYQFFNDDSLFHITLLIKSDHSFIYDRANDLTGKSSAGLWRISHDTLVLNTYDQISNFRLKVKETKALGKNIKFSDIKTSDGKLLPLAMVSINGDTTKLYDPLDTSIIFLPGDVRTLSLFVGRARSEVYSIRNFRANRIDINLDMAESPTDYFFMQDTKFLVSGTSIFPIRGNQIDSITVKMDKRVPIALVKIK